MEENGFDEHVNGQFMLPHVGGKRHFFMHFCLPLPENSGMLP